MKCRFLTAHIPSALTSAGFGSAHGGRRQRTLAPRRAPRRAGPRHRCRRGGGGGRGGGLAGCGEGVLAVEEVEVALVIQAEGHPLPSRPGRVRPAGRHATKQTGRNATKQDRARARRGGGQAESREVQRAGETCGCRRPFDHLIRVGPADRGGDLSRLKFGDAGPQPLHELGQLLAHHAPHLPPPEEAGERERETTTVESPLVRCLGWSAFRGAKAAGAKVTRGEAQEEEQQDPAGTRKNRRFGGGKAEIG